MASPLERGREAARRQSWSEAYEHLAAAADEAPLEVDDLERWAVSAYMLGYDEECCRIWEEAHRRCIDEGEPGEAARCSFWLALLLMFRGQEAQAGGWLARAERMVGDAARPCVAEGYLLVPPILASLAAGETDRAHELAVRATEIGRRFSDADLTAMGILGQGQALVGRGEHERGLALLDEAMVGVTAGEVRPVAAGIIYCAVIETSMRAYDLRRAGEWTAALTRWCEAQPDLVPYRGQCLVHQAQVLQARGSWADAAAAAGRARSHLAEPPHPALGLAAYQEGELHRLRGEFASAEQAYRAASQHGREPLPGLALLRLAQGRPDVAATSIRRALDGTSDPGERPELLAAAVEIMRVAGDLEGARSAADELAAHAAARDAPALLRALAAHAVGAVALAAGEARSALAVLRDAAAGWQLLDMPYEAARTRVLVGLACAALGDADGADLELASARRAFDELGAVPDLARLDAITGGGRPRPAGLTERELEVLRLLATGRSNRAIAEDLVISEHTVARHVQNLFAKLGVSSRAGATAYAYEHQLA